MTSSVRYLVVCWALIAIAEGDRLHDFSEKQSPFPESGRPLKVFQSPDGEDNQAYWNSVAQTELNEALSIVPNTNIAKNVILFLGDGMGISTLTAARIYQGQKGGSSGEEGFLFFEKFPHVGLSKTYNVDHQVPDSAGTGTAYLCGVKTNMGVIGVDAQVKYDKCQTMSEESVAYSIAKWSQDAEKRTGFVTSTRISHASPGCLYAHSANRDWECDEGLPEDYQNKCPSLKDIGAQLVDNDEGMKLNVIMGGGYQVLDGNATATENDPISSSVGVRQDGRQIWKEWLDDKQKQGKSAAFVRAKSQLTEVDLANTEYLMGIFANSHLPYEYEKRENNLDIPTLSEMTEVAINVLNKGNNGFFLMVDQ